MTVKKTRCVIGPSAPPLARSLTHALGPHCSRAPLGSFVHSLAPLGSFVHSVAPLGSFLHSLTLSLAHSGAHAEEVFVYGMNAFIAYHFYL